MQFFARMSPVRAVRDLRFFLAGRERYELGFLLAAIAITGFVIYALMRDSESVEPVYTPNIIYVKQWRLDRTDAQIKAQQKIDQVQKDKDAAVLKEEQAQKRAEFKRLDDKLNKWGI